MEGQEIPSFGQVWALGFMFAVENWPEDWAAPRDKEAAFRMLQKTSMDQNRRLLDVAEAALALPDIAFARPAEI